MQLGQGSCQTGNQSVPWPFRRSTVSYKTRQRYAIGNSQLRPLQGQQKMDCYSHEKRHAFCGPNAHAIPRLKHVAHCGQLGPHLQNALFRNNTNLRATEQEEMFFRILGAIPAVDFYKIYNVRWSQKQSSFYAPSENSCKMCLAKAPLYIQSRPISTDKPFNSGNIQVVFLTYCHGADVSNLWKMVKK